MIVAERDIPIALHWGRVSQRKARYHFHLEESIFSTSEGKRDMSDLADC